MAACAGWRWRCSPTLNEGSWPPVNAARAILKTSWTSNAWPLGCSGCLAMRRKNMGVVGVEAMPEHGVALLCGNAPRVVEGHTK